MKHTVELAWKIGDMERYGSLMVICRQIKITEGAIEYLFSYPTNNDMIYLDWFTEDAFNKAQLIAAAIQRATKEGKEADGKGD